MILIDRIALVLTLLAAVFLLFLGSIGPNDKFMTGDWWQAYIDILALVIKFIVPLWVLMRVLDLIGGGPAKRRGRVTVHRLD